LNRGNHSGEQNALLIDTYQSHKQFAYN